MLPQSSLTNLYHIYSTAYPNITKRTNGIYDFITMAESRGIKAFCRQSFESLKNDPFLVEKQIIQYILKSKSLRLDLKYLSRYTKEMGAKIVQNGTNPIVLVDELLGYTLQGFFVAVYSYADNQDLLIRKQCFTKMFEFLDLQGRRRMLATYKKANESDEWRLLPTKLMHLAADTYWCAWTFVIGHELYHTQHWKKESSIEDELLADAFGYEIFLHMIDEQKKGHMDSELTVYYDYLYLAPMMLMEYYKLLDFFKKLIGKTEIQSTHPEPEKRQEQLFALFETHVPDDMDTREGNGVFNVFLDVIDEFREQLEIKWEKGDFQTGNWEF